jgi:hypothetical protein
MRPDWDREIQLPYPSDLNPMRGVGFKWEMKLLRYQTSPIRWVEGRRAAILANTMLKYALVFRFVMSDCQRDPRRRLSGD